MLLVLFYCGNDRYVCSYEHIEAIVPIVSLELPRQAPSYLIGLMNYGGKLLPVVDWSRLIDNRDSERVMNSRILILKSRLSDGQEMLMGLLTERVTRTIDLQLSDFVISPSQAMNVPYLRGIYSDADGVIRFVIVEKLFAAVAETLLIGHCT